jgi:hypothetical protein
MGISFQKFLGPSMMVVRVIVLVNVLVNVFMNNRVVIVMIPVIMMIIMSPAAGQWRQPGDGNRRRQGCFE